MKQDCNRNLWFVAFQLLNHKLSIQIAQNVAIFENCFRVLLWRFLKYFSVKKLPIINFCNISFASQLKSFDILVKLKMKENSWYWFLIAKSPICLLICGSIRFVSFCSFYFGVFYNWDEHQISPKINGNSENSNKSNETQTDFNDRKSHTTNATDPAEKREQRYFG